MHNHHSIRGRGATVNPRNRFEPLWFEPDEENPVSENPTTRFFKDTSQSIISYNTSPDVNFDASVNPYRGCEHGCAYCYARPGHEYLGFSSGLDFETRIMIKTDASDLLRSELASHRWKPQVIGLCGVTDPYQPVEKRLKLTRGCISVLNDYGNPATIITKNHLVTRDKDIIQAMAHRNTVAVCISITTLDGELARTMEPRASRPELRLSTIETLSQAGIPVGVLVAPVIPGLTDHEIPEILMQAARAGAEFAGYVLLRLPYGVKEVFTAWITEHYPDKASKILNRQRETHAGELNLTDFGDRMKGRGPLACQIKSLFDISCRRAKIENERPILTTEHFRTSHATQLNLFG